jgi:cytochrome b561
LYQYRSREHPLEEGEPMLRVHNRGLKFAYFMLGIALPVTGYFLWVKTDGFRYFSKKTHQNELQEKAVEDSFPASDPPSSW